MAEGGGFRPEGGAGGPRPRMVFKKRDPDAAAKLEEERLAKQKSVRRPAAPDPRLRVD